MRTSLGIAAWLPLLVGSAVLSPSVAQAQFLPPRPPMPAPPTVVVTPPAPPVMVQPPPVMIQPYPQQPVAMPQAPGGTLVQLQSNDLRATLSQLRGGGVMFAIGFRHAAVRNYQTWDPICRMPCGVPVDPNAIFSIRGAGIVASDGFQLPQTGVVALSVSAGHRGVRSGGVVMTTFGSIHTVVGIVFTAIGAGLYSGDAKYADTARGMLIAGGVNLGVGTLLMAGGIAMIVASRTRVVTSDGFTLALGKDLRPKLALSANGLRF